MSVHGIIAAAENVFREPDNQHPTTPKLKTEGNAAPVMSPQDTIRDAFRRQERVLQCEMDIPSDCR